MTTISIGPVNQIPVSVIHALPARAVHMFANGSFTSIDFSNDVSFTAFDNVVATDFSGTVGSAFVRFNGGAAEVRLTPLG